MAYIDLYLTHYYRVHIAADANIILNVDSCYSNFATHSI